MSAKDLPGGQTQILDVLWIERIDHHPIESDEDSAPEIISNTKNWLNTNGNLENPIDSEGDREADIESDMQLDNGMEDLESPELQLMSAAPFIPRLIWPTWQSKSQAESRLVMVNTTETGRNTGKKRK